VLLADESSATDKARWRHLSYRRLRSIQGGLVWGVTCSPPNRAMHRSACSRWAKH